MEKWIYFGIFLDKSSKERLKMDFDIPESWKWYGDHVTLCFNDGSELSKVAAEINEGYVGAERSIKVTGIGISENAMALRVQLPKGVVCTNKVAHITIGCKNRPVDSNAIEIWHDIDSFLLSGEIDVKQYWTGMSGQHVVRLSANLLYKVNGLTCKTRCLFRQNRRLLHCKLQYFLLTFKTSTVQVSYLTKMGKTTKMLVLLIDKKGKGLLMEKGKIIRKDIPEYELEAFIKGL